jgi:hypothetical protein
MKIHRAIGIIAVCSSVRRFQLYINDFLAFSMFTVVNLHWLYLLHIHVDQNGMMARGGVRKVE